MASAYRSAMYAGADSDESISNSSESSSDTVQEGESSEDSDTQVQTSQSTSKRTQMTRLAQASGELRNRILMLTSRGVSYRHRHLLTDFCHLLPHTYRDTKLDTKSNNNYNAALNSLADLHSCNYVFFFEGRKNGQDLYLWLAKSPNGPTIKFSVSNVHTMGELGFGGNVLKGGRGLVVFDKSFDAAETGGEYKEVIREMLRGVFCVPANGVRGMKPFIDRIIGIFSLDGKIWIRVYEIRDADKASGIGKDNHSGSETSLVEVGPRMVLTPIVILEGSFGGPVIYENKQYVSPNQVRRELRLTKAGKYAQRRAGGDERKVKRKSLGIENGVLPKSSLHDAKVFS